MTHTVANLIAEVQSQATQVAGLKAFSAGLEKQLSDAMSGTSLPSSVQANIDSVFDQIGANTTAITNAINTTPSGAPATPPGLAPVPASDGTGPAPPTS